MGVRPVTIAGFVAPQALAAAGATLARLCGQSLRGRIAALDASPASAEQDADLILVSRAAALSPSATGVLRPLGTDASFDDAFSLPGTTNRALRYLILRADGGATGTCVALSDSKTTLDDLPAGGSAEDVWQIGAGRSCAAIAKTYSLEELSVDGGLRETEFDRGSGLLGFTYGVLWIRRSRGHLRLRNQPCRQRRLPGVWPSAPWHRAADCRDRALREAEGWAAFPVLRTRVLLRLISLAPGGAGLCAILAILTDAILARISYGFAIFG